MKGLLYINWTETATPLRDSEVLDKIKQEWSIVAEGTQTKQFNVCNEMVYLGISVLCKRGDIKADKIRFMFEGTDIKALVDIYGSSKVPVAVPEFGKLPSLQENLMDEFLGF